MLVTVALEDRISALTTKDPNKLRLYIDGFDGHSLRAQSYWRERMPDVELAPTSAVCYKAKVGDTDIYIHSEEEITYMDKIMTGAELYALLGS